MASSTSAGVTAIGSLWMVSPAAAADCWLQSAVQRDVDGVVFYLPPDDDVYGWDYPRQRDFLRARGIPSLLVGEEASRGLSVDTIAGVREFVGNIRRRRQCL